VIDVNFAVMNKGRMEAFSDGVFAVIITIMVLEMKVPHGLDLQALRSVVPGLLSYVLSFLYIGIYWNNHHHLLHAAQRVAGSILWANLHLLFWLSLVPFATAWMGENHFAAIPVAVYGGILLLAGIAYFILTRRLIAHHGKDSLLATSIGRDKKGAMSVGLYVAAIPLSFWRPLLACGIYTLVAMIWLLPDPRIEKMVRERSKFPRDSEGTSTQG
jgi:uncharacterized membrane protein